MTNWKLQVNTSPFMPLHFPLHSEDKFVNKKAHLIGNILIH